MPTDSGASMPGGARAPQAFSTTQWSVVARATDLSLPDGRAALEQLCRTYWYPLYWFARRRGAVPHDAEDLTQGFFADLLERGAIARADATRGRFRTFLLSSFQNFQSNQRARASSLKRGGGTTLLPLDAMQTAEGRFQKEPSGGLSPEELFDQKWAQSLLNRVLDLLQKEYAASGKLAWFETIKVLLWGGRGEVSYAEIAQRLGSSEGAVKVAVHRLRQRFREYLRNEVSQTVVSPADVEDEMRHLLKAVSM